LPTMLMNNLKDHIFSWTNGPATMLTDASFPTFVVDLSVAWHTFSLYDWNDAGS